MQQNEQFRKTYSKRYVFDFTLWVGYINPASVYGNREKSYAKYQINFKDGSFLQVILSNRQRLAMRKLKLSHTIDTIGGLGCFKPLIHNKPENFKF
jgi:hypothetical protein